MVFSCRGDKLQEFKTIHDLGDLGTSGSINAVNTEFCQQDHEHGQ